MKKQQGFTLIELVIVVIILGLLGAAAVPRFLDATDDARDASVEGVAGGFASAVGLVRAEWELAGRPAGNTNIDYDGITMDVTDTGYPSSTGGNEANAAAMIASDCQQVFVNIMQSAPTSALVGATYDGERYIVDYSTTNSLCQYVLVDGVDIGTTIADPINDGSTSGGTQGFTYNADTGSVSVFKN
jgi:MSHA pilin protein MshB